jgi:hydroxymethylbilane synthase
VEIPKGLGLAVFLERDDPRDVLVSRAPDGLRGLPTGARVGTSSLRRRVQLLAARRDLAAEPIRGNVDTRLRKLETGQYDAIVLAAAGLRRLGLAPTGAVTLGADEMLPAAGQGTLAVETRDDDVGTRGLVEPLDHPETRAATIAERTFLEAIGGSCVTPLAAYARIEDGHLRLDAFLATPDGTRVLRHFATLDRGTPADLGQRVADAMLAQGAAEIVRAGEAA